MVKSMTAYARSSVENEQCLIHWELKTLNHRYLDISCRLPDALRSVEMSARQLIQQYLGRGKVELVCQFHLKKNAGSSIKIDIDKVNDVIAACNEIEMQMGVGQTVNPVEILKYPGVVSDAGQKIDFDEALILQSLETALIKLNKDREQEGERLMSLVLDRAKRLRNIVQTIRKRQPEVTAKIREKLEKKLQELTEEADTERLHQEWVYMAQKMDIDEELDRLVSHLVCLQTAFTVDEPVGRRLDFLMQEFNREANTVSSKSADAETSKAAVELKVLIEQMREQVQNIE